MKTLIKLLKKNLILLSLILFVVLLRLPVLTSQLIPFQFDHGKDAVAILHMWLTASPKLIGPWTSIPGLFFGPAWYYLLLPGAVIANGEPIASVITMLLLGIVTIVVLYKYFGLVEATMFATSSIFYTITTSAWNPFPMVLLSFMLLAVLKEIEKKRLVSNKQAFILGFLATLGFHFSTAFAVFYPLLIILSLGIKRIKVNVPIIGSALTGLAVPLMPQLLFELRHNFIQTKSVLAYLEKGDSNPASLEKFISILKTTAGEIKEVFFPSSYFEFAPLNIAIQLLFILLLGIGIFSFFFHIQDNKNKYLLVDALLWFTLPLFAFTVLHFNVWYLLPLIAMAFIMAGQIIKSAPKKVVVLFLCLCLLVSISKTYFFLTKDRQNLLSATTFLPNKKAALEYIYTTAGDKPFASYHFMPDIYDYPYQYLYFVNALDGRKLPTEFSYQPGEISYIPEKLELLQRIGKQIDTREPELIFYIIESHDNKDLYDHWWSQQQYGEIIATHTFSDALSVITALPRNK